MATDGIPPAVADAIRRRRPGTDPASLVASGWPGARRMIEEYVAAGISKFVIRPAAGPRTPAAARPQASAAAGSQPADTFADELASELMPLQT